MDIQISKQGAGHYRINTANGVVRLGAIDRAADGTWFAWDNGIGPVEEGRTHVGTFRDAKAQAEAFYAKRDFCYGGCGLMVRTDRCKGYCAACAHDMKMAVA